MPIDGQLSERLFASTSPRGSRTGGDSVSGPRVHLIGAGGAGMTALAELLSDFGCQLTGSDQNATESSAACTHATDASRIRHVASGGRILRIHRGHDSENLPQNADLVVFSPAIDASNLERVAARSMGIPELSYVEMLAELSSHSRSVCIAGTHGKTSTAAMTATILRESDLAMSAVIGGEVIQYDRSGWANRATGPSPSEAQSATDRAEPFFVVEACEYRRHFLQFRPEVAAILNIEADHFDCFGSLDDMHTAFEEFAAQIADAGSLIVRADCPLLPRLRDRINAAIETCQPVSEGTGVGRAAAAQLDWAVSSFREERRRSIFDVVHRGRTFGTVELSLPGRHNVENALAALALAHSTGVPAEVACEALSGFQGVRRRFEEVVQWNGITLVDDYAHHPTAVRATLQAARVRYPDCRLVVAFQPHQISRTQALMDEFAESLGAADRILLAPIFAARENPETADVVLRELANRTSKLGSDVSILTSLDQLRATLEDSAEPGDVWLTLGAGNINRIPHEFAREVRRNNAG